MKTTEEVEMILGDDQNDLKHQMFAELMDQQFTYDELACILVGNLVELFPRMEIELFKQWCDHMRESIDEIPNELNQLKIVGIVKYRVIEHDLVQEVEVTQRAFERLKEREAIGEIFIFDFKRKKGGDAE